MDTNNVANGEIKQSVFTVKNVLRALEIILLVFVFCPSFLVSCSGQVVNVNVMTAVGGVSSDIGGQITDPHPVMLICLILPIVMLVVIFSKKMLENKVAMITLICAFVDFVVWLIFRFAVKKFAEENYCKSKTTAVFVFNILALIAIALISVAIIMRKIRLDSDMIQVLSGNGTQNALNQMSSAVTQISGVVSQMASNVTSNKKTPKEPVIGYCQKCGTGIAFGCKFCTSCGTAVPESMIKEAEERKKAEEEAEAARIAAEEAEKKEAEEKAKLATEQVLENNSNENKQVEHIVESDNSAGAVFCQQCGTKLDPDAAFCMSCGAKVK